MRHWEIVVLGVFLASVSLAQAQDKTLSALDVEESKTLSLQLARCSATYQMVSEVHAVTDSPTLAKSTQEMSNGAYIASAFLVASAGVIPD
jgi:hypothetical protein